MFKPSRDGDLQGAIGIDPDVTVADIFIDDVMIHGVNLVNWVNCVN